MAPMVSRRLLLLGGAALAVAGGGGYLFRRGPRHDDATAALWSQRDPATFEGLVHYATLAANSHNAEAWRFRRTAEGVAIAPDLSRALSLVKAL